MTIQGKEYVAKFITLATLKRVMAIESKMAELDKKLLADIDMKDFDAKYDELWMKRAGCILEGDVSGLSLSKLHPKEVSDLESFFLKLFTELPGESPKSSDATT